MPAFDWDALIEEVELPGSSGVRWLNIDAHELGEAELAPHAQELFARLEPMVDGLECEVIGDLLEADLWPKVHRHGEDDRIRAVSAVGVHASDPSDDRGDDRTSKAGSLTFQLVEMVQGPGVLVTCWHRPRVFTGAEEQEARGVHADLGSVTFADVRRAVLEDWQRMESPGSGDLGLLLMQELIASHLDARKDVFEWLDAWEIGFYHATAEDDASEVERTTLIEMRRLTHLFLKSVRPLNAPAHRASVFWFDGVTDDDLAERVQGALAHTIDSLTALGDMIRSAFDLVQLQLQQAQSERTERFQRKLELITSALLVPTLIAGIYGANTNFPGIGKTWGTEVMLGLMILGAAITALVLRYLRRRDEG